MDIFEEQSRMWAIESMTFELREQLKATRKAKEKADAEFHQIENKLKVLEELNKVVNK